MAECSKTTYPTECEVNRVGLMRRSRGEGRLFYYRCDQCAGWHLTRFERCGTKVNWEVRQKAA